MQKFLLLAGKHILFADDQAETRQIVQTDLGRSGIVVEVCANGVELQQILAVSAATFHAVVVDLWDMGAQGQPFIPDRDLPAFIQRYHPLPFLIYSSEDYKAQQYEDAGARGYVLKANGTRGLQQALQAVLFENCEMYYSNAVKMEYRLNRQDRQILKLLAQGETNGTIGQCMGLAKTTVATYRNKRICGKLGVQTTIEAVALALREGLIQ